MNELIKQKRNKWELCFQRDTAALHPPSNNGWVIKSTPGLSVAKAQLEEAAGATVDFTVRLGRAASASVTLSFDKGDTSKTVSLPVMVPALVEHGNDVLQMTV